MSKRKTTSPLARLPSMTALLGAAEGDRRFSGVPHSLLAEALRAETQSIRHNMNEDHNHAALAPPSAPTAPDGTGDADKQPGAESREFIRAILDRAADSLARRARARINRVINATGIVLHTGLGRAPLAPAAIAAVTEAAGYCNLEFNMETGGRGRRAAHLEEQLCRMTGAEAALIVNNNAAATVLVLAGLATGREVIISRGQLIEIGGSFRLPDVMATSGCIMREVGTTNKTRLSDYERAINPSTALILRVHPSNYRIDGFTETPDIAALVRLAAAHNLPVYDDLGSGLIRDDQFSADCGEPTAPASLRAGAHVISFSGDKLLGGPQAGIILGRRNLIESLRRHPLARALRVDKLTTAALQATLDICDAAPDQACPPVPTLALLRQNPHEIRRRAERLTRLVRKLLPTGRFETADATAFAGGGALPAWPLPTTVLFWTPPDGVSASEMSARLRRYAPPIVARIETERIAFDLRTIADGDLRTIATGIASVT